MVPAWFPDAVLIASMSVSAALRARRATHMIDDGFWHPRAAVADLGFRTMLEAFVDILSLLGSLLSERLRHSQGVYSLSQCVADCIALAALAPPQRAHVLAAYVLIFVGGSAAYAVGALHAVGWGCAWVMALGSAILIISDLYTGTPPIASLTPPHAITLFFVERVLAMIAYVSYLSMLVYDEPEAAAAPTGAPSLFAAVPMFWPWFANVFGALLLDCHLVGNVSLRLLTSAPSLKDPV